MSSEATILERRIRRMSPEIIEGLEVLQVDGHSDERIAEITGLKIDVVSGVLTLRKEKT